MLAVAGLAAVLAASGAAYTAVGLAGAVYLLFLGVQALLQSRRSRPGTRAAGSAVPRGDPWRTGLVSNMFNPKIAVFYTGLLPALAPAGLSPRAGMGLLVLVHATLTALWLCGYVLLLAKARTFFARPAVRRAMDRVTGVVLIGFGLKVAATPP